jgi:aminoglycoside 6'-N-acetyltransferase
MAAADLPMVRHWLTAPHVAQWWGNADEQFALVQGDLDHPDMDQFIVATDGRLFGYLQCYDLIAWPDESFGLQPRGTRAIDQFIGEPDMIDRGHGSGFTRAFVDGLLAAGTPRVLTDPDPANARAIRAYEKAGFGTDRVVKTRDGCALLMVRNA